MTDTRPVNRCEGLKGRDGISFRAEPDHQRKKHSPSKSAHRIGGDLIGHDKTPSGFKSHADGHGTEMRDVPIPKPSLEVPKPSLEVPKPSLEVPKPSLEVPKPSLEVPKPSLEIPKLSLEISRPSLEVPMTLNDQEGSDASDGFPPNPSVWGWGVQPFTCIETREAQDPNSIQTVSGVPLMISWYDSQSHKHYNCAKTPPPITPHTLYALILNTSNLSAAATAMTVHTSTLAKAVMYQVDAFGLRGDGENPGTPRINACMRMNGTIDPQKGYRFSLRWLRDGCRSKSPRQTHRAVMLNEWNGVSMPSQWNRIEVYLDEWHAGVVTKVTDRMVEIKLPSRRVLLTLNEWHIYMEKNMVKPIGTHTHEMGNSNRETSAALGPLRLAFEDLMKNMTKAPLVSENEPHINSLQIRKMLSDGNCLFRSMSDQLFGTPDFHCLIRTKCMDHVENRRDHFEPFIPDECFVDYVHRLRQLGEWGDDIEIQAASELYEAIVKIYRIDTTVDQNNNQTIILTPLRTLRESTERANTLTIRLGYHGNNHYDSVMAVENGDWVDSNGHRVAPLPPPTPPKSPLVDNTDE
eukprot:GHVO01044212.1.p1 GENE.GHVO01044212.1~~GHVO01044212.1.p1  ORF type:complete len:646 (+),score=127.30 GHVO01044212.1:209-1939(+)